MDKKRIFGYCRISTKKQSITRQIDNIKGQYPDAVIIKEEYTGTTTDRPEFNKLLKNLREGDAIVFDEVSRMSRDADEGFKLYEDLFKKGISLIFLKERHIDTDVYRETLNKGVSMTGTDVDVILDGVNKYLMILAKRQIEIAFQTAEAEVNFLHKRTSEGVRKAQERYLREEALGTPHLKENVGRKPGKRIVTKKSIEMKKRIKELSKSFDGTNKDKDVIKILGITRKTYYKYKKELAAEAK